MKYEDPVAWLLEEFRARQQKNPNYSKRAFARLLGISSGQLAGILSRRTNITTRTATIFAKKLQFDENRQNEFVTLAKRVSFLRKNLPKQSNDVERTLSENQIQALSDPLLCAAAALVYTGDFKKEPRWLAGRLGCSEVEATRLFAALDELGITGDDSGTFSQSRYEFGTRSSAERALQQKILKRAETFLTSEPSPVVDFSFVCFSLDAAKLSEAKKMISDFRKNLSELFDSGMRNEVYGLAIQFLPLSKTGPLKFTLEE